MIYKVAPTYGKKNPVIYTSICSVVGSISVMAIKVSEGSEESSGELCRNPR